MMLWEFLQEAAVVDGWRQERPANLMRVIHRLIIAQAQVEGLTIVTCDEDFPAYGVPLLWQCPGGA